MHALHPIAAKARDVLKDGKPGDSFTEQEMAEKLGIHCGPGSEGKTRIAKGKTMCYRDYQVLWHWTGGKNGEPRLLVCCDGEQTLEEMDKKRRHVVRESKRINMYSLCIDEGKLNKDDQRKMRALQVQALMTERVVKTGTLKKLTENGAALIAPDEQAILQLMGK